MKKKSYLCIRKLNVKQRLSGRLMGSVCLDDQKVNKQNPPKYRIMKKVITVLAIVAVVFCLGSCKKKCTCTTTMNGAVVQTVTMEATNCAKLNVTQTVDGMVQETKCNQAIALQRRKQGKPLACLAFFLQQKGCSITDIYIKDLSPIMLIVIYIQ